MLKFIFYLNLQYFLPKRGGGAVQWIYENSSWCLGPTHSMDWKFPTEDLWNLFKTQEEEEAVENNIAFEALSTQQKYDISSWHLIACAPNNDRNCVFWEFNWLKMTREVAGEGEQRSREKAAGDDQCPLHRVVILGSAEVAL